MAGIMSVGPPGSKENKIGTSGDLMIYKKFKKLTGIFIERV